MIVDSDWLSFFPAAAEVDTLDTVLLDGLVMAMADPDDEDMDRPELRLVPDVVIFPSGTAGGGGAVTVPGPTNLDR